LFRARENGDQAIVAIFGAGESFAEAAMFLGGRYPASAETVTPARIIAVDGAAFRRAIVSEPKIALDMLAAASLHLKRLVQQIERLKVSSAPKRIAEYLLDQVAATSGPATITLPYEKALIANRLGMQPGSFSRALAKLAGFGVTVDRECVHIADVARLLAFCEKSPGAIES
jgi:CRP-like cAMP-binding protein